MYSLTNKPGYKVKPLQIVICNMPLQIRTQGQVQQDIIGCVFINALFNVFSLTLMFIILYIFEL